MRSRTHVLICMIVPAILISCSQQDNELELGGINRYYITRSTYKIDPGYLDEKIELGDGIDMSNPLSPEVAPHTALEKTKLLRVKAVGLPKSSDVIKEKTRVTESLSEREEANILSTYFKASYMLSSVEGAYENARKERESYHTIYALLEHSGESDVLQHDLQYWRPGEVPVSESIADPDEALLQFLKTYGSHYVTSIRYGLHIAVQGKIRNDSKVSATEFFGKFKAAFGAFSAEAGARNQHKQALESMGTELLLEVTSGGREKGPSLLSLRGFDDISKFLEDLKNDTIQFRVAPIQLTVHSYWPILNPKWKKMRALLSPERASFKPPTAPFGVPKGTIIAWHPPAEYLKGLELEPEKVTINPPDGWAICDGNMGTPDLSDHFIRGTTEYTNIGLSGGAENHTHGAGGKTGGPSSTFRLPGGGKAHVVPDFRHTHSVSEANHLPPYTYVVYIIKL